LLPRIDAIDYIWKDRHGLPETLARTLGFIDMSTIRLFAVLVLTLSSSLLLMAQPPQRGGGDRGGFGGRGGPEGGFGGRGGPEGGFGGRGGSPFGGGPPGGGFRGRGGPGGGPGGSRGGFDPSSFLSRLDSNGNGVLDPDEQQGPAQFIIQRLQQNDSSIRPGQPIPLQKITEGFQRMREGRDGGRDDNNRGRGGSDDDALMPELLVPGFGLELDPVPLMGFGAAAEMLSVTVTEEDEREAAEMMQRFDRNRDGVLSGGEISSRFSGNPLDFDRNKDGKLTASELAVRYARRREGREESRREDDRRRNRQQDEEVEIPDVFNGRRSYRAMASRSLPEGLPGYFTDKDANGDGQVTMAEFASEWSDETVKQFFGSDLNRDGVITAEEALTAVENPGAGMSMASVSAPAAAASPASAAPAGAAPQAAAATPSGPIDDKYLKVGQRIIERYDKNNDQALTASEWEKMLMSPAEADANRDGRVTIEEYALWMMSRERK
jgi:Ca2+-binding EF-hand superfamily protein